MIGFCAILPGKKVTIGTTWEWQGDLLNTAGCGQLVAKFTLTDIVKHEGKKAARITGKIEDGWPEGLKPKATCELLVSLADGVPLKASFDYESKTRTEHIRTTARWIDKPQLRGNNSAEK